MTGMITSMIDGIRRRVATAVLWGALAAVALSLIAMCIVVAIVLGLLAIYLQLSSQLPPPAAAAVTAGIAILLAVVIAVTGILAFWISARRHASRPPAKANSAPAGPDLGPLGAVADEAADWVAKNPLAAVIGAFAAGSMFAISPPLRKAAVELIAAIIRSPPPRDS